MPRNQACPKCGVGLEITEDGHSFKGYSPFTAERYFIDLPDNVPPSHDREKDNNVQDK